MRTLTDIEVQYVSGGEAPCITLGRPCVGPPPDAGDVANATAGLAVITGLLGKFVPAADWVSKGSALLTYGLIQIDRNDEDRIAEEKKKEDEKKKGT